MIVVNISEIRLNMGNVDIKGKIVNMNNFMLAIDDETGQIFVRYSKNFRSADAWQKLLANLKIGNTVKITNCEVVNYHGILQLKLTRKGEVIPLKSKSGTPYNST